VKKKRDLHLGVLEAGLELRPYREDRLRKLMKALELEQRQCPGMIIHVRGDIFEKQQ
jgi:hypothetical protein